jgi:hypothetical protein
LNLQPIAISGWQILVDEDEFTFEVDDEVTFKKGHSSIRARVRLSRRVDNDSDMEAVEHALGHVRGLFIDDSEGNMETVPLSLTSKIRSTALGQTEFDVTFITEDKKWAKKVSKTAPNTYSLSLTWPGDFKPTPSSKSVAVVLTVRPGAPVEYGVAVERTDGSDLVVRKAGTDGVIRFPCTSDQVVPMIIFALDKRGNPIEMEGQSRQSVAIAGSAGAHQRVIFVSTWPVQVSPPSL